MNTGTAAGWNVYWATTFSLGGSSPGQRAWHWSAYGPNGGTHGTAKSEDEAVRIARRECEWLNKPRTST